MGSITENRLGGISLIVGIPGATILWLVFFLVLGGSDPADFAAQAETNAARNTIQQLLLLCPPMLLILSLYGFSVIYANIKESGTGAALFRLGLVMFAINVIGIVISFAIPQAGVWHIASGASSQALSSGVASYTGMVGAIGAILSALALASRSDYNKIFAYVVAVAFFANLIFGIYGWVDTSVWQLGNSVAAISFVIISAWSVTLGLGLLKKA